MNSAELKTALLNSRLFDDDQIGQILHTVGSYTLGNAIIACEMLNIELYGNDIDVLIDTDSAASLKRFSQRRRVADHCEG